VAAEDPPGRPPTDALPALPPPVDLVASDRRVRWMLTALFVLAVFYTLYLTRDLTLPIVLAVLLNFLLRPVVRLLQRLHIPLFLASALVVLALLGGVIGAGYALADPASMWLQKAPQIMRDLERKLRPIREKVEEVNKAAQQVEKITNVDQNKPAQTVHVSGPSVRKIVLDSAQQLIERAIVLFFLLYFLLATGDAMLNRLVGLVSTRDAERNLLLMIDRIEQSVSRYLASITVICAIMGTLTALLMYVLGMPNPILWGTIAGFLNFIPYIGPMVMLVVLSIIALLTFDTVQHALLVPASYFALEALEGQLLTPMLLGRHLALNPILIFLGIIFWGWLWGPAGALLAVPILMTTKVICEHVCPLAKFNAVLGR
jgi:predicted PurR-regulated permease PerM